MRFLGFNFKMVLDDDKTIHAVIRYFEILGKGPTELQQISEIIYPAISSPPKDSREQKIVFPNKKNLRQARLREVKKI